MRFQIQKSKTQVTHGAPGVWKENDAKQEQTTLEKQKLRFDRVTRLSISSRVNQAKISAKEGRVEWYARTGIANQAFSASSERRKNCRVPQSFVIVIRVKTKEIEDELLWSDVLTRSQTPLRRDANRLDHDGCQR